MKRSRINSALAFNAFAAVVCHALPGWADGGIVQFSQVIAPYRITVFTSPAPVRTGMVDMSILVQDADTGVVVQDANILLKLHHRSSARSIQTRASSADSTNKLLQSCTVDLPAAGEWQVNVEISGSSSVSAEFTMIAATASENQSTLLVCLALPWVMIGLFLVREHLVARQTARSISFSSPTPHLPRSNSNRYD